jgi:hypothetical protein
MKHKIPLMQAEGGAIMNIPSGACMVDIAGRPLTRPPGGVCPG